MPGGHHRLIRADERTQLTARILASDSIPSRDELVGSGNCHAG